MEEKKSAVSQICSRGFTHDVPARNTLVKLRTGITSRNTGACPRFSRGSPGGSSEARAVVATVVAVVRARAAAAAAPAVASAAAAVAAAAAGRAAGRAGRGRAGSVVRDGPLPSAGDSARLHEAGRVPSPFADGGVAP